MKRVQRHLGIASSPIADSDIAERKFEQTTQWVLQSETIVEKGAEDESSNESVESTLRGDPEPLKVPAVTTPSSRPKPGIPAWDGFVGPAYKPLTSKPTAAAANCVSSSPPRTATGSRTVVDKMHVSRKALRFLRVDFKEGTYHVTAMTTDALIIKSPEGRIISFAT